MNSREFEKLKIYNLSEITDIKLGEYFLTPNLESQKVEKRDGDEVSVYLITEVKPNGNILYEARYITLG